MPLGWNAKWRGPSPGGVFTEGCRSRSQGRGGSLGQFPDVNPVLPCIGAHNPLIRGIRLHLVRVPIRPLMGADRETYRRRVGGGLRPNVIEILLLKHRRPERPTRQNREDFEPDCLSIRPRKDTCPDGQR
jgi:hypothetical protein